LPKVPGSVTMVLQAVKADSADGLPWSPDRPTS